MKKCDECGKLFEPNSNRQKYCKSCQKEVKREQCRINMQKYRKRWRVYWGRNNKRESLGSGLITSPHMNPNPEEEKNEIIRELKYFRLKSNSQ